MHACMQAQRPACMQAGGGKVGPPVELGCGACHARARVLVLLNLLLQAFYNSSTAGRGNKQCFRLCPTAALQAVVAAVVSTIAELQTVVAVAARR